MRTACAAALLFLAPARQDAPAGHPALARYVLPAYFSPLPGSRFNPPPLWQPLAWWRIGTRHAVCVGPCCSRSVLPRVIAVRRIGDEE